MTLTHYRKRLPLAARTLIGRIRRSLPGHPVWGHPEFVRQHRELRGMERWSREALEADQMRRLRALLDHAYAHVPFYKRRFDEEGLRPADVTSMADLRKLPILTKEQVRENLEDLTANNIDRKRLLLITTSGSSGHPLKLYHDEATQDPHEDAYRFQQWSWAGYRFGDPIIVLSDRVIDEPSRWDYDAELNGIALVSGALTEERMHEYVAVLRRFRPRFIWAFPAAAEILAAFLTRHGIKNIKLQAAFLESERIYPWQREMIQSGFDCQVFGGYGQSERVVDAVECEQHNGYHVNMSYGIMELVDDDFQPITEPGVVGRVVGTGLDTFVMPFIRYELDDLAMWADGECSCGRASPLVADFVGRPSEHVLSRSGQRIPLSGLYTGHGHKSIRSMIRDMRFVQEQPGVLTVKLVVPLESAREMVRQEFQRQVARRVDESELQVEVVLVDEIPVQGRGKRGFLEQLLPLDERGLPIGASPSVVRPPADTRRVAESS